MSIESLNFQNFSVIHSNYLPVMFALCSLQNNAKSNLQMKFNAELNLQQ